MEKKYGLLGEKLGHSYSAELHALLAPYRYQLFSVQKEALPSFLKEEGLAGLNVTIPYKQAVIPYCAALSKEAAAIGSVNTMVRRPDGSWWGHNTDYEGFLFLSKKAKIPLSGQKVLVLGSGGTSRTVCAAIKAQGGHPLVVSRGGEVNYQNAARLHGDAEVLVNTTPVGMYPQEEGILLHPKDFAGCRGVLDVVYNPLRTQLVLEAKALGLPAEGGLAMLAQQAKAAAQCFTGAPLEEEKAQRAFLQLTKEKQNIVLVGMPGCGKTTVGELLAKKMGRPFVDLDAFLAQQAGCSIAQLFEKEGEEGFRRRERAAVKKWGKESGLVLATGGGAPLAEENRTALMRNGWICFLQRELSFLATQGRPLSVNLAEMYRRRAPVYTALANAFCENSAAPEQAAAEIERMYHEAFNFERP